MKNILITGASGMLGATLAEKLSDKFKVFGTGNSDYSNAPFNYLPFDLGKEDYSPLIEWSNPEIIIHCAALTNGNECELNPTYAFEINGVTVQRLLKYTADNVKFIYISTDAVYPSHLHLAKESDCTFPESVYGKSKEIGEFFLLNSLNREYLIIRTTIVGLNKNNKHSGFVEWILNSVGNKNQIGLFADVLFSPISIWHLSQEIDFLISKNKFEEKVLNIAGNDITTKYAFGIALVRMFELDEEQIKESSIEKFEFRAKRSMDQSLSVKKYQSMFNRRLPSLKDTIESIKINY